MAAVAQCVMFLLGDGPLYRDAIIEHNVLPPLLSLVAPDTPVCLPGNRPRIGKYATV